MRLISLLSLGGACYNNPYFFFILDSATEVEMENRSDIVTGDVSNLFSKSIFSLSSYRSLSAFYEDSSDFSFIPFSASATSTDFL
jgi:hypothetical protein